MFLLQILEPVDVAEKPIDFFSFYPTKIFTEDGIGPNMVTNVPDMKFKNQKVEV
jgi:hypothetical protein